MEKRHQQYRKWHQNIPQDVQKAAQQGRSERKAETYSLRYVEALSDARTKLEAFFNILLEAVADAAL